MGGYPLPILGHVTKSTQSYKKRRSFFNPHLSIMNQLRCSRRLRGLRPEIPTRDSDASVCSKEMLVLAAPYNSIVVINFCTKVVSDDGTEPTTRAPCADKKRRDKSLDLYHSLSVLLMLLQWIATIHHQGDPIWKPCQTKK